jgi:hypothetical protein
VRLIAVLGIVGTLLVLALPVHLGLDVQTSSASPSRSGQAENTQKPDPCAAASESTTPTSACKWYVDTAVGTRSMFYSLPGTFHDQFEHFWWPKAAQIVEESTKFWSAPNSVVSNVQITDVKANNAFTVVFKTQEDWLVRAGDQHGLVLLDEHQHYSVVMKRVTKDGVTFKWVVTKIVKSK